MKHPELLASENPLFDGLSPFIPMTELPGVLLRQPLADLDWKSLRPELREPLLALHPDHFFPTDSALEIASSVQGGLRAGLLRRNPLNPREQRRINKLSLMDLNVDRDVLQSLASPASGGILAAETGAGKTTIIKRALEVFAPDQVIYHSRSESCGWSSLTQVLYLHVDLPSNGSRLGLIGRILGAADALLGTDYTDRLRRLKNVDLALLLVMKVLSVHRVGILVLDEGQQDNFQDSPWQREFILFFLSLMNLGVPVFLCGHPSAFSSLKTVAQVMRRFSDIGIHRLQRALTGAEPWWKDAFVPGKMRMNLCDEIEKPEELIKLSQKETGGIPGVFSAFWVESQRTALRRGGEKATLRLSDFTSAWASPRCAELARMARWLDGESTESGFDDLASPAVVADTTSAPKVQPSTLARLTTDELTKVLKKLVIAEKRAASKKKTNSKNNEELLKKLSPDDLRNSTRILDVLAGLDSTQADLPGVS